MTFPVTIGEFVARYRWPTDLHAARPIYPGEIPGLNTARFFEEAMRIESMSPQDLFLKGYIRGCSAKWSTICGSGYFSSIDPINDPLARFCIEEGRRTLSEGDLARLKKLFTKSLKSKDHITLRGMEIGRNLLSADTSRCGEVFGIPRAAAGKERSSGKGSGTVALLDEAANFNAFFAPLYPRSEVRSVDISRSLQKQIAVTALAGAGVAGGIALVEALFTFGGAAAIPTGSANASAEIISLAARAARGRVVKDAGEIIRRAAILLFGSLAAESALSDQSFR